VDLGTGDGRSVLRRARAEPARLFIGVDPALDGLAAASRQAARRADRGGAPNALFVLAALEDLPAELAARAGAVTVWFPWGSLLRAVAAPDDAGLRALRALCAPGAALDVVFSLDGTRDAREAVRLGLDGGAPATDLAAAYARAGFGAVRVAPLSRADLLAIPSTWAQRHAHGRPRPVSRVRARVPGSA
jgi:16S rRNA (adenine(1408)-N(1))-methyltransferase